MQLCTSAGELACIFSRSCLQHLPILHLSGGYALNWSVASPKISPEIGHFFPQGDVSMCRAEDGFQYARSGAGAPEVEGRQISRRAPGDTWSAGMEDADKRMRRWNMMELNFRFWKFHDVPGIWCGMIWYGYDICYPRFLLWYIFGSTRKYVEIDRLWLGFR